MAIMALSPSFRRTVKAAILTVLVVSLFDLGLLLYFGVFTIPYLSPVVLAIGNSLSPFTPLFDPAMAYVCLKQWLHRAANGYRATLRRRRYVAGLISQSIGSLMLIFSISLKFTWVMESVYGWKVEEGVGMCIGPCWKLWTELVLLVMVVFAVIMGWDLDGGLYDRFMDRQIEKLKQHDAEKAAKEILAAGADTEKAADVDKSADMEKA
jgi:hypothetical protein